MELLAPVDGADPELALRRACARHGEQKRQGGLAFAEVVAGILAERVTVAGIVEGVVDQLEGQTQVLAVFTERPAALGLGAGRNRAGLGGGGEQLGGLGPDDVEIDLLREVEVMGAGGIPVTGSTGVERALADATDLVLMDLRLPELDGWEATRRIKATKPRLPIIACSANVMQADLDRAEAAGCDAFLAKPYQVADLITTVTRFVT